MDAFPTVDLGPDLHKINSSKRTIPHVAISFKKVPDLKNVIARRGAASATPKQPPPFDEEVASAAFLYLPVQVRALAMTFSCVSLILCFS
jgi:hypothetical protein